MKALVGAPGNRYPISAMSIADGPGGHPVMILTAGALSGASANVLAIDLVTGKALWRYEVPGPVNAGDYVIEARFADTEAATAGHVSVRPDGKVTVSCSSVFLKCTAD